MKLQFLLGSVFVIFVSGINGEATPQRSRLRGVTPGPEVSSTSSSQAVDGPLSRLRRPTRRTTTPLSISTTLSTTTATTRTTQAQSSSTPIPSTLSQTNPGISSKSYHRQTNSNDSIRQEMIDKLCHRKYGASSSSTFAPVSTPSSPPPMKKHNSTPKPSTTTPTTTTLSPVSDRGVKVKGGAYAADNFAEPQRTLPRNPLLLRRSQAHIRVPRRVKKLTRSTTLPTTTTSTEATSAFPPFPTAKSTPSPLLTPTGGDKGFNSSPSCTDFDHLTDQQLAKRVKGGLRRKHKPEN